MRPLPARKRKKTSIGGDGVKGRRSLRELFTKITIRRKKGHGGQGPSVEKSERKETVRDGIITN